MIQNPNRLFAIPIFGMLARFILLIPVFIWISILAYGAFIGYFFSCWKVLFNGQYPDSTFEFIRDEQRLAMAVSSYIFGLSDTYPSMWISMNHKAIKWILIILGALYFISSQINSHNHQNMQQHQYNYGNYQYNSSTTNSSGY